MTAESTEQKAQIFPLNQTVSCSLTSIAAEITVTKRFSLLPNTLPTCFHIIHTYCTVECTAYYPQAYPTLWSEHSEYATHGQNGTTAAEEPLQQSLLLCISVAKQLCTLISVHVIKPGMHFPFVALPFICFSPHFQQIRSQYSCACASPSERAFRKSLL